MNVRMNSLTAIDEKLEITAKKLNAILIKNETKGMWLPIDYEERSITWQKGELNYLIQIYPTIEADRIEGWNFWQVVSTDIGDSRYWRRLIPVEKGSKKMITDNISSLLNNAVAWLTQLNIEDLEFATKIHLK